MGGPKERQWEAKGKAVGGQRKGSGSSRKGSERSRKGSGSSRKGSGWSRKGRDNLPGYQEACCKNILHDSSHMACIDGVTLPYTWAIQSATQTIPANDAIETAAANQGARLMKIYPSP